MQKSIATGAERARKGRGGVERTSHVADLVSERKPPVVAAAIAVGVVAVAGLAIAAVGRRRRRAHWLPPQRPSALSSVARTAGAFLFRLLARQVASQLAARLGAGAAAPAAPGLTPAVTRGAQ